MRSIKQTTRYACLTGLRIIAVGWLSFVAASAFGGSPTSFMEISAPQGNWFIERVVPQHPAIASPSRPVKPIADFLNEMSPAMDSLALPATNPFVQPLPVSPSRMPTPPGVVPTLVVLPRPLDASVLQQHQRPRHRIARLPEPTTEDASHAVAPVVNSVGDGSRERIAALISAGAREETEGNIRGAIHAYHQALELDATNRMALIHFARLKHRLGDLDGAIVMYRQSLKLHPNDPTVLNDLALCFARLGDTDAAIATLRVACHLQPNNRRYINNLAAVLVEAGSGPDALELLKGTYGDAVAHYNLGHLAMRRGATAQAMTHLRQTLALDPSFQPAQELLERLDAGGGDSKVSMACAMQPMDQPSPPVEAPEPPCVSQEPEPASTRRVECMQRERAHWNFLQRRTAQAWDD